MSSIDYSGRKIEYRKTFSNANHRNKFSQELDDIRKQNREKVFSIKRRFLFDFEDSEKYDTNENTLISQAADDLRTIYQTLVDSPDHILASNERCTFLKSLEIFSTFLNASDTSNFCELENFNIDFPNFFQAFIRYGLVNSDQDLYCETVHLLSNIAINFENLPEALIETTLELLNKGILHFKTPKLKQQVICALSNLSDNFISQILASDTLNIAFETLSNLRDNLSKENAGLIRSLFWLLSNLFRCPVLSEPYKRISLDKYSGIEILFSITQKLITSFLNGKFESGSATSCQSSQSGPINASDDERGAIAESLWTIYYLILNNDDVIVEIYQKQILDYILPLIKSILNDTKRRLRDMSENCSENVKNIQLSEMDSIFYCDLDLQNEIMLSGVDILQPALSIIRHMSEVFFFSVSSEKYSGKFFEEISKHHDIFHQLITCNNTLVINETTCIIGIIASSPVEIDCFVPNLLPCIVRLLEPQNSFVIKRQAAVCILDIIVNHDFKYLDYLLQNFPHLIDHMISLFDDVKYDKYTITVALDFVKIVSTNAPDFRNTLHYKGIIEKMENVQFLHDEDIERRVSSMVEDYFDDIEIT